MRILHLIYDHVNNPWVGGGGAVRVRQIYKEFTGSDTITIVCGRYPGAVDYEEGNLRFHFVGIRKKNYVLSTFFYALGAMVFLSKEKRNFDIVIEDFAPYNPVFSFAWRRDAIIQLHQKEGLHIIEKYLILGLGFAFIEEIYPRFFKRAIALSEIGKRKFGLSDSTAVITNGFDKDLLETRGIEGDYILFLGRIHIDSKGLDILRAALEHFDPKIKLIIAGAGIDSLKVKKMFNEYINTGRVRMIGFINGQEKTEKLKNCRLMVMPSRYEGRPLVLLEAAACERPVIVSDIPELEYAVNNGFALSFRRNDPEDLAAKINFLLGEDSLRSEMGRKGRDYAQGYTWDKLSLRYKKILGESLKYA